MNHETTKIPIEALYKDIRVELGKANSYILEIEHLLKERDSEIERLKSLSNEEKIELKKDEFYKKQNKRIRDMQLKVRDCRKDISRYLTELTQFRINKNS